MNYAKLAFTPAIKALQKQFGSRSAYEKMEQFGPMQDLTPREIQFITQRDSFYVASYGTNEFPYIQHRGGPKGFVKVIDQRTLAFLDFSGNKQYITVGNIQTNNRVALIMVDYANRARLKLYAKATVKSLDEDPQLTEQLELSNYQYKPERIIMYQVEAYDWNCPQHITPRYTAAEIQDTLAQERNYITQLEAENKALKSQLKHVTTD